MGLKQGRQRRQESNLSTISFYVPDWLHEIVQAFALSLGIRIESAYLQLLSRGLLTRAAREYLDLQLRRNFLRKSELYSEYSQDNSTLRELVDPMRSENAEMRELLLSEGLLRNIPEKHRSWVPSQDQPIQNRASGSPNISTALSNPRENTPSWNYAHLNGYMSPSTPI